jgi:F0F1-type ATP synthase assembly protein I
MAERKPDNNRGYIMFAFVILLGYIIGIFLKRVPLGLMIGLVLGLLGSGMLRRRR